jgi:hypothetical protein
VIRFLIRVAVFFAAAAIGLFVATLIFDDVDVNGVGFVSVAVIYAIVLGLMTPFLESQANRSKSSLLSGGVGLIATFVALLLTELVSDDLSIEGAVTWIGATVVVWLVTLLASLLLPVLVVKRVVDERHR